MTRVKICGLTRPEDVALAVSLGANMLGFIHVAKSPRYVDVAQLNILLEEVPANVESVVVVQNPEKDELARLRDHCNFNLFQFHGDEPLTLVQRWVGYKVFHIKDGLPNMEKLAAHEGPFLLDTQIGATKGGTGKTFDWEILPKIPGKFLVAGGLNVHNVGELVKTYQPWGVDVSSGIEAEPGVKDHVAMKSFMEEVRRANEL